MDSADAGAQLGLFRKQRDMDAGWLDGGLRKIFPDFFGRKNKDGRGNANECAANFVNCGLCGTPRRIVRRLGVEAIFQDVVIESAEVHDAIVVDGMVNAMEFVRGIPLAALLDEICRTLDHPAVHLFKLIVGQRVA